MFPPSLPSPGDLLRSLLGAHHGIDALNPLGLDLPGLQEGDGPDGNNRPRDHHDAVQRQLSERGGLPPGAPGSPALAGPGHAQGVHGGESAHPLLRELQQLPPDTLRQLTQYLSANPNVARELMANPESLASTLARAGSYAQESQFLASTMARSLELSQVRTLQPQAASAERTTVAQDIVRLQATPDGRFTRDVAPASNDANRLLPASLLAPQLARADGSVVTALPAAIRGDAVAPPQGNPAAAAQGTTTAPGSNPLQNVASRSPGEATIPARAEGPISVDRFGLPSGNALALGVTVATVANPAGTTHAVAPQTPAQQREANRQREALQQDKQRQHGDGARDGDGNSTGNGRGGDHDVGGGSRDAGQAPRNGSKNGSPVHAGAAGTAQPRAADAAAVAVAVAVAGNTTLTGTQPGSRPDSPRASRARSLVATLRGLAIAAHLPHATSSDATSHPEGDTSSAPAAQRSRALLWLYWSLILVAYLCLGVSFALVLPGLMEGAPSAADVASTDWRRALTVIGLATAFCAWLLARRLR